MLGQSHGPLEKALLGSALGLGIHGCWCLVEHWGVGDCAHSVSVTACPSLSLRDVKFFCISLPYHFRLFVANIVQSKTK